MADIDSIKFDFASDVHDRGGVSPELVERYIDDHPEHRRAIIDFALWTAIDLVLFGRDV